MADDSDEVAQLAGLLLGELLIAQYSHLELDALLLRRREQVRIGFNRCGYQDHSNL